MSFMPTDDALEFGAVVRRFLEKHSPEESVRRWMSDDSSYDPHVWQLAATELGLHGLSVPEEFAGSGAGYCELGVVFEELGRSLYGAPMLASVGLATSTLLQCADASAKKDMLPRLVMGESVATVGWAGHDPLKSSITAVVTGEGAETLHGHADYVLAGPQADILLVVATAADGPKIYVVEDTAQLQWSEFTPLDQTRKLAHTDLTGIPARRLPIAAPALAHTVDIWTLLLAAEQLGGASRALEQAVDYARTRVQFGRTIGSFQAIKHRCADMLVEVELARTVVWHGLWTADHDPQNLGVAAALAGSVATDAYTHVAAENIQIHGGIGFTWEHPAHLYLKRAKASSLLLRSTNRHRDRLATLINLPKGA
ncbi:acyl-CoA dehydrogenase family protein [Mycolicibacterium sp. XJ662]